MSTTQMSTHHVMTVTTSELVVLMLRRSGHTQQWLADQMDLSIQSVVKKINGTRRWQAHEMDRLMAIVLPRLDSNQQPVDYRLAA